MPDGPGTREVHVLVDNPTADDQLDRGRLVRVVAEAIASGRPLPLTVAIYGEWGSGKSSFMERVRACIDPEVRKTLPDEVREGIPDVPAVRGGQFITVYFNLWEHQNDVNPVIAMLDAAREELGRRLSASGWRGKALVAWRNQMSDWFKGVLTTMVDTTLEVGRAAGSAGGLTFAGTTTGTLVERVHQEKEARFAVQDQQTRLKMTFDKIIDDLVNVETGPKSARRYKARRRAERRRRWFRWLPWVEGDPWVHEIGNAKKKRREQDGESEPRRVVFFIDDLDRCHPEVAVDLLEKIRLFLGQRQCVFVLGADENAVRRVVKKSLPHLVDDGGDDQDEKEREDKLADLYLEKMVQYAIYLPPISAAAYLEFTRHVLGKTVAASEVRNGVCPDGASEYAPGLLAEALIECNATLRQTIRVVNSLNTNHFLARGKVTEFLDDRHLDGQYDPRITAIITLIQILYPKDYRLLREAKGNERKNLLHSIFDDRDAAHHDGEPAAADRPASQLSGAERRAKEFLADAQALRWHAERIGRESPVSADVLLRYLELTIAVTSEHLTGAEDGLSGQGDADTLGNYALFLARERGEVDRAREMYERALAVDPGHARNLRNYASLLSGIDPELADQVFARAVRADPTHANTVGDYATFLTTVRRDQNRAEDMYAQALRVDPKHVNNLGNYAAFLRRIRGDEKRAEEMFERALELDPEHVDNLGNYAVFLERTNPARSGEMYERALGVDPRSIDILWRYADFLEKVDPDRSEQLYERALELDPQNEATLRNYATFLLRVRGEAHRADELYARTLGAGSDNAENLANYAVLLERVDPGRAGEMYEKAMEFDPRNVNTLWRYADFMENVDADRAEQLYEQALGLDPRNTAALRNYAGFLIRRRGNLRRAEDMFKRALEVEPYNLNTLGNYAVLLEKVAPERAGEMYERALSIDPRNADVLWRYADFLEKVDPDRAEQMYERALEIDTRNVDVLRYYARFLAGPRGNTSRADEMFRKALEVDPKNLSTLGNYAVFLEKADRPRAEEVYERALGIDSRNADILWRYADFLATSDPERAEHLYEQALEVDPQNADTLRFYARFLARTRGDTDRAEEMYRRALQVSESGQQTQRHELPDEER
ncbi:MAG: P-loop NTPase fold protein [Micrococcales bacterium]|nr:P-loop NTPase fold protein [Micrococcales bacterium]